MNKRNIVLSLIAVGALALNVVLAADHGTAMYASGKSHGCNEGFDFFLRQKYGIKELPMQVQLEIAMMCVDAAQEKPQ